MLYTNPLPAALRCSKNFLMVNSRRLRSFTASFFFKKLTEMETVSKQLCKLVSSLLNIEESCLSCAAYVSEIVSFYFVKKVLIFAHHSTAIPEYSSPPTAPLCTTFQQSSVDFCSENFSKVQESTVSSLIKRSKRSSSTADPSPLPLVP